jgi:hypothetical protein
MTAHIFGHGEEADFEALSRMLAPNLLKSKKLEFTTSQP